MVVPKPPLQHRCAEVGIGRRVERHHRAVVNPHAALVVVAGDRADGNLVAVVRAADQQRTGRRLGLDVDAFKRRVVDRHGPRLVHCAAAEISRLRNPGAAQHGQAQRIRYDSAGCRRLAAVDHQRVDPSRQDRQVGRHGIGTIEARQLQRTDATKVDRHRVDRVLGRCRVQQRVRVVRAHQLQRVVPIGVHHEQAQEAIQFRRMDPEYVAPRVVVQLDRVEACIVVRLAVVDLHSIAKDRAGKDLPQVVRQVVLDLQRIPHILRGQQHDMLNSHVIERLRAAIDLDRAFARREPGVHFQDVGNARLVLDGQHVAVARTAAQRCHRRVRLRQVESEIVIPFQAVQGEELAGGVRPPQRHVRPVNRRQRHNARDRGDRQLVVSRGPARHHGVRATLAVQRHTAARPEIQVIDRQQAVHLDEPRIHGRSRRVHDHVAIRLPAHRQRLTRGFAVVDQRLDAVQRDRCHQSTGVKRAAVDARRREHRGIRRCAARDRHCVSAAGARIVPVDGQGRIGESVQIDIDVIIASQAVDGGGGEVRELHRGAAIDADREVIGGRPHDRNVVVRVGGVHGDIASAVAIHGNRLNFIVADRQRAPDLDAAFIPLGARSEDHRGRAGNQIQHVPRQRRDRVASQDQNLGAGRRRHVERVAAFLAVHA